MTSDEHQLVCYDADKQKPNLYIHSMKNGSLIHKLSVRYTGFKEVLKMVPLPDKPSVVALIDVEKGNLMDLSQKRIIKSIPFWDGTCSKDGRYGLYAPATGGMEMLDLRTGRVCKTLIPKVILPSEATQLRHEICQTFYTAGFSGQKFYTLIFTEFQQFW